MKMQEFDFTEDKMPPARDCVAFNNDPTSEDLKKAREDFKIIVVVLNVENKIQLEKVSKSVGPSPYVAIYLYGHGTEEDAKAFILDCFDHPDKYRMVLGKTRSQMHINYICEDEMGKFIRESQGE